MVIWGGWREEIGLERSWREEQGWQSGVGYEGRRGTEMRMEICGASWRSGPEKKIGSLWRWTELKFLSEGDIETEVATTCIQERPPEDGRGHQYSNKIFNPKFILPTRCSGIKMEKRLRAQPMTPLLEIHSVWLSQLLTLLMTVCYVCRQEPNITISREASSSSGWRQRQRPTAKQFEE